MLTGLSIRDVVLIERLDVNFDRGLGVFTGETGAGKSILLDALGLALGMRADPSLVRDGAEGLAVSAVFDLPDGHPGRALLAEQEIPEEGEVILRRQVSRDGRSRAFINDRPVSVGLLRALGESLIEIHGQHDDRGLLDPSGHRALLDAYAGHDTLLAEVRAAYLERAEARRALAEAEAALARAQADEDYVRHVAQELAKLAPEPGEEARLSDERRALGAAEKLAAVFTEAAGHLDGDGGAILRLGQALRRLERGGEPAAAQLRPALDHLARALDEANDASEALARAAADFPLDPRRLEAVEERLHDLRAAARKHGVTCDGLAEVASQFATRVGALDHGAGDIAARTKAAADADQKYQAIALRLSAQRQRAGERLDKAVAGELKPLKLDRAKFRTSLEALDEPGPEGLDRAIFEVATNPGAPFGPLLKIASGGELSRFILALKVALARQGSAGTLVFDEIDRGIGGAVAAAVGERLSRLSAKAQVLVVTHSPQVAARADHHWRIAKSEKAGRAQTRVEALDAGERQEEIARMIAGAIVTDEARAAALALLKGAAS